ncbi:hypothetical protein OEB99_03030 [Actinotalea sp. M2MS4P-6]|uniref:hypothetical protein n=1 Tax=Actinotalea sp. M2MS4P-6 TaxID=2983762 RepID=UPI0021E3787F|nr:hypothetical protein [Actinotalea sp. M2MS4P-6]MCV2393272.1 hypothetical protein [Actinotalea sp. M2MS4P-6]
MTEPARIMSANRHPDDYARVILAEYDGASIEGVKVGTVRRAKDLEFKPIRLCDVSAKLIDATGRRPPTTPSGSGGNSNGASCTSR